jgi:protein phosphatase
VDYAVVELIRASLEAGSSDNVTCVVADVVDLDAPDGGGQAARTTTGPITVGAAAEQARRGGGRGLFRGHRGGDTGEIEPVPGDRPDGERPDGDADPEELRYAPRPPRRGRWLRRLTGLLVVALVLAVAGLVAYRWSQDQYYVAEHNGNVAIYRGVQADIPGLRLSRVEEETNVTIAALPDFPTEQVAAGMSATSLADARNIVSRLTSLATVCPTTSPSPSAGAGRSPTGSPSGGPTARPTRSPTARPSSRPATGATPRVPGRATASPSASPAPTLAPPDCIRATT